MANLMDVAVGNARAGIGQLDPAFAASLSQYVQANPGLSIYSSYRSNARQRELFAASDKSGRMVARPGHSQHEFGRAADLRFGGARMDENMAADVRARLHKSAGEFGLTFPMSWEPWHVEPLGARKQPRQAPQPNAQPETLQANLAPLPSSAESQGAQDAGMPVATDSAPASLRADQEPQPWIENTSYSGDAIMRDLFAGQNPLKRFAYQKIMGLWA